ncbi:hypothetical protein JOY44_20365 [Phormidium sp. CLA17]|uniref:hypothetical protein n=1 Tax=Leptolyngbya sp. Cla-17 TaxID=2803751 RepID=UPI001491507C|nr:hypothetical protein [Leptolyngbya sp. Cla-17]MBM0743947.1 hypothetical protein [Leptolyngbya sp. Cla-17]
MHSRQGITEIFSTFVEFSGDRFNEWTSDRRLHRNMLNRLESAVTADLRNLSNSDWALYWHRAWMNQSTMAAGHLTAYLQETCYWVDHKLTSRQTGVQYSLPDFFQIAIASLPIVLKGYCPKYGASLQTYASLIFSNTIRDTLRQQKEADSRTDWGLLRKLIQKRLTESLQQAGLSVETIAQYCLAWQCFKTLCVSGDTPTTRRLSRPDAAIWEAIAQLYNQQRLRQLSLTAPECDPKTLKQ